MVAQPKTKRTLSTRSAHSTSHYYRYLYIMKVMRCWYHKLQQSHIRLNQRNYLIIHKMVYAYRMLVLEHADCSTGNELGSQNHDDDNDDFLWTCDATLNDFAREWVILKLELKRSVSKHLGHWMNRKKEREREKNRLCALGLGAKLRKVTWGAELRFLHGCIRSSW